MSKELLSNLYQIVNLLVKVKCKNNTKMQIPNIPSLPASMAEFSDKSSDVSGICFKVSLPFLLYLDARTRHWIFCRFPVQKIYEGRLKT